MVRIVTIGVVRNEEDILEAAVRHHAPLAHAMLFMLHRSADGSRAVLERLRAEGLPVAWEEDTREAYLQDEMLTSLLRRAALHQPDWVLPLDADEFLAADEGDPGATLASLAPDRPHLLPWRTYVPTPDDDPSEPHPLRRITHRRRTESPGFSKVLVPGALAGDHRLLMGSHGLTDPDGTPIPAEAAHGLFLAHLPVRTEAQLRTKVLNGWRSHLADTRAEPRIFQWRDLHARCADPAPMDPAELTRIARTYAADGDGETVRDPVPTPAR